MSLFYLHAFITWKLKTHVLSISFLSVCPLPRVCYRPSNNSVGLIPISLPCPQPQWPHHPHWSPHAHALTPPCHPTDVLSSVLLWDRWADRLGKPSHFRWQTVLQAKQDSVMGQFGRAGGLPATLSPSWAPSSLRGGSFPVGPSSGPSDGGAQGPRKNGKWWWQESATSHVVRGWEVRTPIR